MKTANRLDFVGMYSFNFNCFYCNLEVTGFWKNDESFVIDVNGW